MGEEDEGVAIDLARPSAAPPQLRAAAKARLLAASLGAPSPSPERERIAGRYRLVREIGRGGMGSVWEAELVPIGKRVAIKLLRREAAGDHAARLLREAQAASAIGHEHIVRVDDFGVDADSGPFLVMELLRGRALSEEIAAHAPMPWPRVAGILVQLCSALAAAHDVGIVHRDLKPANVFLVRREGGTDHCKLLDFGLCKPQLAAEVGGGLTTSGARLGTPGYMAPEQIRAGAIDGRADLYALGCVAYEMLSGQPPFTSRRVADLIDAHLHDAPPPLSGDIPADALRLVARALAKDPADRFADAHAMTAALRATGSAPRPADHTVLAHASVMPERPRTIAPRRMLGLTVVALALGATGGALAVALRDEPPAIVTPPVDVLAPAAVAPIATPPRDAPAPPPASLPSRASADPASVEAPASTPAPAR
ncbi:MAG TPA: protein kinase, partial [Nannocystaceae bacterium]|nr:protein kinase [Nannocystaceae bacterium]